MFGYSRGAYAVRSLAGLIARQGLLKADAATDAAIDAIYDRYRAGDDGADDVEHAANGDPAAAGHGVPPPRTPRVHAEVPIQMIGVFDTVRALGTRWPMVWRLSPRRELFHDHRLAPCIRHGRHALALHETRDAYAPVLWDVPAARVEAVRQVWFRGTHGDIGGQLAGYVEARPLANIPLVWMLSEAEALGLALPTLWRGRYLVNPDAPSIGLWRGYSKMFWRRSRRRIGHDPSESLHASTGLRARDFHRASDVPMPQVA